jgi:hypothetical protein
MFLYFLPTALPFLYFLPTALPFPMHYTAHFVDLSGSANPLESVRNFDEDLSPLLPSNPTKKFV